MATATGAHAREHRRFYVLAGTVGIVIAFVGFARTYFLKGVFGTPVLSPLLHLHGIVMTVWVVLFVTQAWLVAARRTDVHRRLGIFTALWAGVVLVMGTATGIAAARLGHSPGPPPLRFLATPMMDMVVFGSLIALGLFYRANREVHRRLMLLATLSILTAALGRLPIAFIQSHRPISAFVLTDLLVVAFIALDTFRTRRLHPAFLWGGICILASHPLRIMLSRTDAWLRFANWLTG